MLKEGKELGQGHTQGFELNLGLLVPGFNHYTLWQRWQPGDCTAVWHYFAGRLCT